MSNITDFQNFLHEKQDSVEWEDKDVALVVVQNSSTSSTKMNEETTNEEQKGSSNDLLKPNQIPKLGKTRASSHDRIK